MEIQVNIDCADPTRMPTFYCRPRWATCMHGRAGDQYRSMVAADGDGPKLVFQKVPEAEGGEEPGASRPHRREHRGGSRRGSSRSVRRVCEVVRRVRVALDRDAGSRRQRDLHLRRLIPTWTRAFVAICPPASCSTRSRYAPRRSLIPEARRTPREQWHVTLQFLGNDADVDAVVRRARTDCARAPGSCELGGRGRRRPNAQSRHGRSRLGVAAGSEWLDRAGRRGRAPVLALGHERERRTFHRAPDAGAPARAGDPTRSAAVEAVGVGPVGEPWRVDRDVGVREPACAEPAPSTRPGPRFCSGVLEPNTRSL